VAKLTFAGLVTEVDGFYKTEEANKPLPIAIAERWPRKTGYPLPKYVGSFT
jgi:hypothetical protein